MRETDQSARVTRRGFLQATAALAATGYVLSGDAALERTAASALAAAAPAEQASSVKVLRSECRGCHGVCGVLVHVQDGRVIKVEGDPDCPTNKGTLCPKGLSAIQHLYHPDRLKYPMKRVGERGENKWQRMSWDEALDYVAGRMKEIWETKGKQYIGWTGGTGRHWRTMGMRFFNACGMSTGIGWAPLCYLPRIGTCTRTLGYRIPVADLYGWGGRFPKTVVVWGNNIVHSNSDGLHCSRLLETVFQHGAKLVVIDPVYTNLAAKADVWLPVRPATDGALAMSFINVIIEEDLWDHAFVTRWTNAPYLVRMDTGALLSMVDLGREEPPPPPPPGPPGTIPPQPTYVVCDAKTHELVAPDTPGVTPMMRGSLRVTLADGRQVEVRPAWDLLVERAAEYTPEKVAEITWCPADKIREAARLYADSPSAIQWGNALDMHGVNCSHLFHAIVILWCLTGNLDVPGGQVMWQTGPFRKQSFPNEVPPYSSPEMDRHDLKPKESALYGAELSPTFPLAPPGPNPAYITRAIAEGRHHLEMDMIVGCNPLVGLQNSRHTIYKALMNIPFLVVLDLYMTSTCQLADVVLPVSSWLERNQIGDTHLIWGIIARQAAVEPVWEDWSDEKIFLELAKRLGMNDLFPWETVEEWLDWRLEPMGMTWKQFVEKGIVSFPQIWREYEEIDPVTGKPRGFRTPTGKAEIFATAFYNGGLDPLPFYVEPPEETPLNEALANEYPLINTTRRIHYFFHSEFRQVPWLRELAPEPLIEINPKTAAELGIADGDWVWVETARGRIRQKARLTPAVHPRVVCSQHDWWFPEAPQGLVKGAEEKPDQDGSWSGAFVSSLNVLTRDDEGQGFDPGYGDPQLRGWMCKVYKAEEGAPTMLGPTYEKWMPMRDPKAAL